MSAYNHLCEIDWGQVLGGVASAFTGNPLGGIASAVGGLTGGTGGGSGSLVGGTVTRAGGGLVFVKTKSGREVAIRRKRSRRGYRRYGGGGGRFNKMIELAMIKSLIK